MIWLALSSSSRSPCSPTASSRPAGCAPACSRSRSRACRRSSTASGSRISPTSTSACPPAAASPPSARSPGWRSGSPISSASPATSSPTRAACRCLVRLLGTLERPFVVLGNHDVAVTRDPFSRAAELDGPRGGRACCSATRRSCVERAGRHGSSSSAPTRRATRAATHGRGSSSTRDADLRILLCHFPGIARKLPAGRVPPRARRAPPRGPDRAPVPGRQASRSRTRARASSRGSTRRRRRAARLAGHRHDVRAVPVLRPPGGDGARAPPRRRGLQQSRVMEGHSLISTDILASYAADAALEIDGVARLVEGTRPRHHGVRVTNDGRRRRGRAPPRPSTGASTCPRSALRCRSAWPSISGGWPTSTPATVDVVVDDIGPPPEGG